MRWIDKSGPIPLPLQEYIEAQSTLEIPVGLDYRNFPHKGALCRALTAEQFGLCAFTGAPIRDTPFQEPRMTATGKYGVHNAHLKPQARCRQELVDAGRRIGRDLGEDMDHRNIVAALEVRGSRGETFGAAAAGDWWDPGNFVSPTLSECEQRFRYAESGAIESEEADGEETIKRLILDHPTLSEWRQYAVRAWIDPLRVEDYSQEHLQRVVAAMDEPEGGALPDFCFVIKHVAEQLLNEAAEVY